MKKMITLFAMLALLLVPAIAQAHTHPVHCPKGKHRNGRHCVKNHIVRGPQGEAGVVGPVGPAGPVGAAGAPGINGSPGTAGAQGPAGPAGPSGSTGPAGPAGPGGPEGKQGNEGKEGKEGPQGEPAPTSPYAYDNITPESLVDNPVSLGYAATGTTEFGSQIVTNHEGKITNPEVEVLMSVWACEVGEWNSGCISTGGTFPATLTLDVYEVTYENAVGALLGSTTETFNLTYRPTSDPTCSDPTKFKAADGNCQHGQPEPVTFDYTGTLPRKSIVAVSFTPSGPTDALNVGLEGPPSIGQNPLEAREGVYWDSQWYGQKLGTFHLDEEPELPVGESQLAVKVTE